MARVTEKLGQKVCAIAPMATDGHLLSHRDFGSANTLLIEISIVASGGTGQGAVLPFHVRTLFNFE